MNKLNPIQTYFLIFIILIMNLNSLSLSITQQQCLEKENFINHLKIISKLSKIRSSEEIFLFIFIRISNEKRLNLFESLVENYFDRNKVIISCYLINSNENSVFYEFFVDNFNFDLIVLMLTDRVILINTLIIDNNQILKEINKLNILEESQFESIKNSFIKKNKVEESNTVKVYIKNEEIEVNTFKNKNEEGQIESVSREVKYFKKIEEKKDEPLPIIFIQTDNNKNSKQSRLILTIILFFITSVLTFFFIRNTVDWSTLAKVEFKRYNDSKHHLLIEKINEKFKLVRNIE